MRIEIDDLSDERVAGYRGLQDSALRGSDVFVVEGRLNVRLLVESPYEVASIFASEAAAAALDDALAALPEETPIYVAPKAVLSGVVGFPLHRGCVALARRSEPFALADVVARAAAGSGLCLVLEDLTDQENVGTCFRNAMAFGVAGVVLSPRCCDPLLRKATRVSMGGTLQVPFARAADDAWPADLAQLVAAGFELVALHPAAGGATLAKAAARLAGRPLALLVGSEGPGLSQEALAVATEQVRIEMASEVDSVNVATAAAIALHALAGGRLR